jgi:tetratricopeptide (TPR) repeat protein
MSLNAALDAAGGGPEHVINFIQVLARSSAFVVTDKPWDSRTPPEKGMRLMLVSDGSNEKQVMLAIFTTREHASNYLHTLDDVQHPFKTIAQVDMAWAALGIPANAGIMINPNSEHAFRISPEVAMRLRRSAQLSVSFAAADRHNQGAGRKAPVPAPAPAAIEQSLFEIEDRIIAGDLEKASAILKNIQDNEENAKYILCARSMLAQARGELDTAIRLINEAIQENVDPRLAGKYWSLLARYYEQSKKPQHAEDAYVIACSSDPTQVKYALDLSKLLSDQYRTAEAMMLLQKAVALQPTNPLPNMQLGNLLVDIGQEEAALAAYDKVAAIDRDSGGVQFNRAICLQALGRLDEARLAFEHALRLDPTLDGYSQYAQIRKFNQDDAEENAPFLELLERRAGEAMPMSTRIDSSFALAKTYDSLGNLEKSFEYLRTANKLKRSTLSYVRSDSDRDMDAIKKLFDKEFIGRFTGTSSMELAPIFVLGMPRSGTTLTEQILAGHSRVNPGNELTHLANMGAEFSEVWSKRLAAGKDSRDGIISDLRRMGETYAERTTRLQVPGKRFTDKMPGNFLHIGLIYLLFPNASVIHCHRHPADTCLSCYERLFTKSLAFSYDQQDLAAYYKLYLDLMQHWREILPKGFILDVEYEKVVTDPENQIRRLLDFCKLDFEATCLEFHKVKRTVTTASSLQVRKPMYTSSLNRWKKYGDKLKPLVDALGPELMGTNGAG